VPNCIQTAWILIFTLALRAALFADIAPQGMSHDYLIHSWQTDDGLPENWVSSITQTPDGYIWIGTRYGGLARFDGVRFVNFNQQNTPELKDVQVEHLSVDKTGTLWIIMGNESITAFRNGRFHLFRWPRSEPRLRAARVLNVQSNSVLFAGEFPYLPQLNLKAGTNGWRLFDPRPDIVPRPETFVMDQSNDVWFITLLRHLGRFSHDHFELMEKFPKLSESVANALAVDANHRVWLATPHHLACWNGHVFMNHTPTNGPPPTDIRQIAFSGDGGLWVLEKNRLRKCLDGRWVTTASPWHLQNDFPSDSFQLHGDAQGGAWLISNGDGLWHIKSNGSARHLTEKDGLPSLFITCWFQDREGDVWIGTAGGGIARIRESIFHVFGESEGLPGKVVRSVCADSEGKIWAGTLAGGLAYLQGDRFIKVPLPAIEASPLESITVAPGSDGNLWVGSLNHGLMQYRNGKITQVATPAAMGNFVRILFTDRRGQLWAGSLVNLFRLARGKFKQFGPADGFVDSHAIESLAEDANGALWIGTGPGALWKFDQNKFTRFRPPPEWPSVRFSALLPETNGVIWVGTLGGGLLCFHDGKFTRCTTQNGLPDNDITQLLDDREGYIWGGTYAGIFRASKGSLKAVADGQSSRVACRVYGRFEGLPALECSSGFQPSCWRTKNGELWFSTANGLVSVNPSEVKPNRLPPSVIIEEMLVDGKPRKLPAAREVSRSDGEHPPILQIEPGRHYLQFRYTGLNFAAPDGVRFRVKLEGAENQWRDVGGQRQVGYGPLPPGKYQFRVLACNNDGVWNEQGVSLAFAVLPFFWETWWFKAGLMAGAFVVLAIMVALAQRRRYRYKLERLERQREMERERTRIARDLHDDLGTTLTQISLLSTLANRDQTPPPEVKSIIEQVRSYAREMVTALDEIVWAVNPKNDSLAELASYLSHFAEQFFRSTNIRCRLEIPNQLPTRPLQADVRHHLFLAFKEALNNVARHSGATQVLVRVDIDGNQVIISIEDNGHGFAEPDASSHRDGNGLINMRRRIEETGGRTEIRSISGRGTVVTFYLPLNTESSVVR
jgi:signal transduction histidine kinase/ligand-binding sensor domain-containing protein